MEGTCLQIYLICASNTGRVTSIALPWGRHLRDKTCPDLPKNAISSAGSFVHKRRDARPDKDAHLRLKFARLNGGYVIRSFGSSIRPLEHTSSPVCSAGVLLCCCVVISPARHDILQESGRVSPCRMQGLRIASYVASRGASAKRYVADEVCVLLACLLTKKLVYSVPGPRPHSA